MAIVIVLTGGLGNQLFQAAAALNLAGKSDKPILFDTKTGTPRKNREGIVELYDYLNFKPKEFQLSKSKIFKKIYRMNLLISAKQSSYFISQIISILSTLITSIMTKKMIRIFTSNGIGFDSKNKIKFPTKYILLIGYYQSYLYFNASMARKEFQISDKKSDLKISKLAEDLNINMSVIIHVRRGDYLKENSFGILDLGYYLNAIRYFEKNGYQNFLVFSDDITEARAMFKTLSNEHLNYFEKNDLSSSQVMELMTYAGGFIIANSTFSWWAGYLRKDVKAKVCAPKKWFAGQKDPNCLIPEDWVRM